MYTQPQWQIVIRTAFGQFRGIMPILNDSSDCVSDANKLAERRKEEKEKFDARHQCELKPLVIGSSFFLEFRSKNMEHQ